MIRSYYLGAPMWSNKDWVGSLFRRKTPPGKFLAEYAKVLNTNEGNTTFYSLPAAETVERWRRDTPKDFRFCFKFPRSITHEERLGGAAAVETQRFFRVIEPLADRIGQVLLQLPPSFDTRSVDAFTAFLPHIPRDYPIAVEVRNLDFYRQDAVEQHWVDLLIEHGLNYAMFDTSALHEVVSDDPAVLEAQAKKPKLPQRYLSTSTTPWLRYVGHDDPAANDVSLARLALTVSDWISAGKTPYVFMHSPRDVKVPELCRCFHQHLAKWSDVGLFPDFPGETEAGSPSQLDLF